jgi:tRNA modification GTPase
MEYDIKTIAAIATPLGEGGVAMIRISGSNAFKVANEMFSKDIFNLDPNYLCYGQILSKENHILDDVMLAKFLAPKSFTGEHTVEIFCHGGMLIQKSILQRAIECGAEHALPGEFSYQSFMNGKMDLAQAEAIQELIGAKNQLALKAAENQLQGILSKKILSIRQELLEIAAIIDAWVDYPEEGLEFKSQEELLEDLNKCYQKLLKLKNSFHDGKKISHGINLCLLGAPNAGKSSLMNALLGFERAIVTPIAGTTRDILQEDMNFFGLHFNLIDTAGIRETEELIEKEGIRRSKNAAEGADLILYVLDSTKLISLEEKNFLNSLDDKKLIIILNKCDLPDSSTMHFTSEAIKISAKEQIGLEDLKNSIMTKLWAEGTPSKEEAIITKERHFIALKECLENLDLVFLGFKQQTSCEFISFDLRMALKALGSIIGFDVSESILDSIFSKFCVGK